jgi:hypothetical protein
MSDENEIHARIDRAIAAATPKEEPEEPEPKRRARRRPTLTSALKQAKKLGVPVSGATLTAEGVSLTFGEPSSAATDNSLNPWTRKYAAH